MFGKNSFIPRAGIARTGAKVRTAYRRSNMAMLLDCSAAPLLNYHSVLGLAATVPTHPALLAHYATRGGKIGAHNVLPTPRAVKAAVSVSN